MLFASKQTQKMYDYDEIMSALSNNANLQQDSTDLQKHLKELRELINQCEPLYHGKGNTSPIYTQYKNLYDFIGNCNRGLWAQVYRSCDMMNRIYHNAYQDKQKDEERYKTDHQLRGSIDSLIK